ncbi:TolC family protein [bacterium]|nr:TolC family protein [bacterium]
MKNKFLSTILIVLFLSANIGFAGEVNAVSEKSNQQNIYDINNLVDDIDYPDATKVAPQIDELKTFETPHVIEGSVEKTIDVTLEQCIKFALGNNPRIREAIEEISASDARIKQAWSNYFPNLDWTSNVSKNKNILFADAIGARDATYTYFILGQISVSQLIYDFGVTQNQVTIKKLGFKTAQENLISVVNDVIKDTKEKYYALLYTQADLKVKQENVDRFELFYNQAKALYEIGMNPKVDVTIAEVNLSNAKMQLILAKKNTEIAAAQLNNSMGINYMTHFNTQERLRYAPCDITLEEAVKIAEESRPDLKIAKLRVESLRQTLQLTKKSYFPQITAQGNFAIGGSHPTSTWGYMFGGYLDFPVVNIMNINNQIKEARANYSKQMAASTKAEQDIHLEIQTAYYNLVEKRNQIPVAFLGMKQAKENYDISYGRYRVGEGNPIELKDSQITYMNSQLAYYNALYNYNAAKANLEKAIGKNLMFGEEVVELNLKDEK